MNRIQLLDPQTVEQIRAGEVIERPGSVVKELVENAIDAGAQTITVSITEGGIREIMVQDDGQGLLPEDAVLAVQRHATSKIRKSSDLFALSTLGFRGEALASISAISHLEIVSRVPDAREGIRVSVAGSEPAESAPIAASQGTTMRVRHLFFNTPPRKAFLKSPVAEGNYIEDVLIGLALSRPELRFIFKRDQKFSFDALAQTGPDALRLRACAVLGKIWGASLRMSGDGLLDNDSVQLHGIVGPPDHNKNTRTGQYFFVNGRQIKSQPLSYALSRGYGELLPAKRFPVCVLFLTVPPQEVDANVHPTKREVKFQDEQTVLRTIVQHVRRTLDQANLFKTLELPATASPQPFPTSTSVALSDDIPIPDPRDYPIRGRSYPTATSAASFRPQHEPALRMAPQPRVHESVPATRWTPATPSVQLNPPGHTVEPAQPALLPRPEGTAFRVLGQSHELFILVEVEGELWVIDQHAAHERVMYEQVLAALRDGKGESQALLLPITFDLEASARTALDELQDYLTTLGFDIRPFGGKTYQVQAAPPYFRPADTPDLITELAQARADGRSENSIAAKQEDLAARVACKVKSVKAGQTLTPEPMKALVKSLLACQSPFSCPHGRPTMVRMSVRHLEGQFDRH
jgi:DNA mismatch repair protein MutL